MLGIGRLGMVAVAMAVLWSATGLAFGSDLAIRNLRVVQVPRRAEVVIQYDLDGPDGTTARVDLAVSEDGGKTFRAPDGWLMGAVGWSVETGSNRRLVWTAGGSWLERESSVLTFRIQAFRGPSSDLVQIRWGTFTADGPKIDTNGSSDESSTTEIRATQGFFIGKYEVTQGEWNAVMGNNPSYFKGDPQLPVVNVNWYDAMEYCRRLTERDRLAGRLSERGWEYRLPTEREWEHACRAGTTTATAYGDGLSSSQANFDGNYPYGGAAKLPGVGKTVRVGNHAPNGWGLHDMNGNVWEWCLDRVEASVPGRSMVDPAGPKLGSYRVIRGGHWRFNGGQDSRLPHSILGDPGDRLSGVGFRPALVPVP